MKYIYLSDCILNVQTDALQIGLTNRVYWSGQAATRQVQADNVSVEWPPLVLPTPLPTVSLTTGASDDPWIRLTSITLEAGSRVNVDTDSENNVLFHIQQEQFRTNLLVHGEIIIDPPPKVQLGSDARYPDSISFSYAEHSPYARLMFRPLYDEIQIRNILINNISFSTEVSSSDTDISLGSGIIEGNVIIPQIDRTVQLSTGSVINLENVNGLLSFVQIHDHIKLHFEGTAGAIMTGPPGHQRQLLPSVLEYLYYGQRLSFITGIIGLAAFYYQIVLPSVFRRRE